MGFRIKGKFPDARYFSFNVYSLRDNTTQGSLVDYEIASNSGQPNPFIADRDSVELGEDYTVHIVPSKHKYNVDDFGGVDFPTVEAFTMEDGRAEEGGAEEVTIEPARLPRGLNLRGLVRKKRLPEMVRRLGLLYETERIVALDGPPSEEKYLSIPFHAIDTKKKEDEVYVFRFKAPSFTTGPEDINQTEVRYWSFNLGNSATYNFNAVKDEDAQVDDDGSFLNGTCPGRKA